MISSAQNKICSRLRFCARRANVVEDLTNTNAHLTAENARLNDRMAKLVKDLTEENKQLLDENQCLNATVKKVRVQGVVHACLYSQGTLTQM